MFFCGPRSKAVQALVRERMKDWGQGMCKKLGKKMVELTGDYTPDLRALLSADVIIATPEKWDGISRSGFTVILWRMPRPGTSLVCCTSLAASSHPQRGHESPHRTSMPAAKDACFWRLR